MTDLPYHQSLRLKNFTAFQDASFDFVPGINVFVGENGTGKTHVMKAMYAMQLSLSRERDIDASLKALFQLGDAAHIVRSDTAVDDFLSASGQYGEHNWSYYIHLTASREGSIVPVTSIALTTSHSFKPERPVFIPAIDMMGHTKGFTEAYEEVRLDFDLTCRDIVNLLRLERRNGKKKPFPAPFLMSNLCVF